MTTKDYIKLSLIAAGYVKNIRIDIEKYGIDTEYSVYGETWGYTDDGSDDEAYLEDSIKNTKEGCLYLEYEPCLLSLIEEIQNHKRECAYMYRLLLLSNKDLLNDEIRESVLMIADTEEKETKDYLDKMKPVDDYITKICPCNNIPNCGGDFDDSDTCSGFWKCTHQYHHNCKLRYEDYRTLADNLQKAYKKYAYGEEMTEEETNLLKEHKLI